MMLIFSALFIQSTAYSHFFIRLTILYWILQERDYHISCHCGSQLVVCCFFLFVCHIAMCWSWCCSCQGYMRRWLQLLLHVMFQHLVTAYWTTLSSMVWAGADMSGPWLFFLAVILHPLAAFPFYIFICIVCWGRAIDLILSDVQRCWWSNNNPFSNFPYFYIHTMQVVYSTGACFCANI